MEIFYTGNTMNNKPAKLNLEWNDSYSLDVPSIDTAHKEIFQITSLLLEKNMADNREAVVESIEFLKNYVNQHFADEENYMLKAAYPGYKNHAAEHQHFREKVVPSIEERLIKENYSRESVDEFIEILTGWLTNHIMIHDKIINLNRYL